MQDKQANKQNVLMHLREQPFIVATGFAAFVHSTWSLGTWFAGIQPAVDASFIESGMINGAWVAQTLHVLYWIIPAALIAFALDVGQIATSRDIQRGMRTRTKYATFMVFAVATYYLQWLYLAYHMPVMELSDGIRPDMLEFARLVRDASIWVIPMLLPLSTLLYTFSHADAKDASTQTAIEVSKPAPPIIRVEKPAIEAVRLPAHIVHEQKSAESTHSEPVRKSGGGGGNATGDVDASLTELDNGRWQTVCICGKVFENDTPLGAKRACSGHQAKCTVYKQMTMQPTESVSNG